MQGYTELAKPRRAASRVYWPSYLPFDLGRHFSHTPLDHKRLLLLQLLLLLCTQLTTAKSEIPCRSDDCLPLSHSPSLSLRHVWSAAKSSCMHWICCIQRSVPLFLCKCCTFVWFAHKCPRRRREKRPRGRGDYKGRWQTRRSASTVKAAQMVWAREGEGR